MEGQKRNEMVCAQNQMNSRNDGERKNHIDDGERPAATTTDREEQSTIFQFLAVSEILWYTMALVSCSSAWYFPRNRRPRFTHDNDENERI